MPCGQDGCSWQQLQSEMSRKPSRPRMAKLGLISSISKKLVDNNTVKVKKPLVTKQNSTPNVKAKQPPTPGKARTTPRNRRPVFQDPAAFQSVWNRRAATALGLPKKRKVAKTLMFYSPKKQKARTRTLPNEMDGVKTLCGGGMKKLEITDGKKQPATTFPTDLTGQLRKGRDLTRGEL